jgi:carboxyl-terminal processing protease
MRRRRRPLIPVLVLLLPVMLVAGIWLGGHPDSLPDPVRDTLVDDGQGRIYDEALDMIARDYYREVDRDDLLDQSLEQAVRSLNDRFSHYFAPRDYDSFQEATEGRFEGVGMTVEEIDRGLRVLTVYEGSPAARGGLEPGDVITHVDGR